MRKRIRLKECDGEFLTRRQGEVLRERLVKRYEELELGDLLTIDFAGIDTMTPSFADECFGKFAERIGARNFRKSVSLIGASETIQALVNSILAKRILPVDA